MRKQQDKNQNCHSLVHANSFLVLDWIVTVRVGLAASFSKFYRHLYEIYKYDRIFIF